MPRYRAIRVSTEHPLAVLNASLHRGKDGDTVQIWTHRAVLFERIGYSPHLCHWCGKHVRWDPGKQGGGGTTLVADHVNGDRRDNDPSNLVPSCQGCNAHRNRRVGDDELFIMRAGKRIRSAEQECRFCAAKFLCPLAEVRKGNGLFCSRSCRARFPRAKYERR